VGRSANQAVVNADHWLDDLPVPSFGPRIVCNRCGIVGADSRPNWKERPERESLTGAGSGGLSQPAGKLMHPLPSKAISSVPELANRTPFAFVVDSLLVRATDYSVGHRDR
jgi:hypothetical protein